MGKRAAATVTIPAGLPVIIGVPEAAEILGVSRRQVYSMVQHRAFPEGVVVRVGRSVLIIRPRLLAWAGLSRNEDSPL